jgi:predicted nucleic acid-binding protein
MIRLQILCDTNIVSELARPAPNPSVLAWSQQLQSIVVSVITLEEIAYGLAAKPNPRVQAWLEKFFATYCSVLPITAEISQVAGQLRGHLKTRGQTRTQADMLIAATAKCHNLLLATRNTRDFEGCDISIINPFQ